MEKPFLFVFAPLRKNGLEIVDEDGRGTAFPHDGKLFLKRVHSVKMGGGTGVASTGLGGWE